jgi:hypothetical protein
MMKNFYEMMMILEDDGDQGQSAPEQQGLGDKGGKASQQGDAPPSNEGPSGGEKPKHYMFFSNLKMIKEKAEAILSMDPIEVDSMLGDGHDWASDHISTSRDDVEEVYNWLAGEMQDAGAVPRGIPPMEQEPPQEPQQGQQP